MSDFIIENGILRRYNGSDSRVTVPEGVREIGDGAFSGNLTLSEVFIPESVKWIAGTAFYGCKSLVSARISEGVTAIGTRAFVDCVSLRELTLPDTVGMIHMMAFLNCSSLTSVRLPSDLQSLETCVFQNCTSLARINIPNSVVRIERSAFYNCPSLDEVLINPQKLHLINVASSTFSACLRGCFTYSEQNTLTDAERERLDRYANMHARGLAPWLINHLPALRYITEHGILQITDAQILLKLCVNTECRALMLNYIGDRGEASSIDEKYGLL